MGIMKRIECRYQLKELVREQLEKGVRPWSEGGGEAAESIKERQRGRQFLPAAFV